MNKYSSKAIKTAATVGMSLAMVLSAMPAVGNVTPVYAATCETSDVKTLRDLFATAEITKESMTSFTSEDSVKLETTSTGATYHAKDTALDNGTVPATGLKIVSDASTPASGEIKVTDANALVLEENGLYLAAGTTNVDGATNKVETANASTLLVEDNYVVYRVVADNTIVKDAAKPGATTYENLFGLIKGNWNAKLDAVANNCSNETAEIAEYLLKLENEISVMFGTNYDGATGFVATVKNLGANVTSADLEALYRFQTSYEANLNTTQKRTLKTTIEKAEEYLGYDSSDNSYQKALSKFVDGLVEEFEKFVEDSKYTDKSGDDAITKAEIKSAIAKIKQKAEYARFRNEDSVKEVIASYEGLYDDIEAVEDAIDTKNDAYVDYTKGGSNSIKNKYKEYDTDGKIDNMKTAHFEIYKAFKESIVDAVYTMESKESVNRFIDKSTKSPFVTGYDLETILNHFDVKGELYTIYDDEDGTFGWDALEKHMTKVNDSLKALEDLSKYDAITLSVNDKDALVKMDDAVYFLQTDGVKNLTSSQTRTVRDAARKVTELMEAYRKQFGSIDSTVNGWVNKGNGDYAYYENGVAPAYKWVASGSNWYFVKNGVMMRNYWLATDGGRWYYLDNEGKMVTNQSVDGCWINSYGVYVSPSYKG